MYTICFLLKVWDSHRGNIGVFTSSYAQQGNTWNCYNIQGLNFKLSHFWFYLKTCLNCTNCKIFIQNKKQVPAASIYPRFTWNLTSQPQLRPWSGFVSSGRTLQKPAFRLWPCRPWWIYKKNIKCGWEYTIIHYPKLPKKPIIFFLWFFFWDRKKKQKKNTFWFFSNFLLQNLLRVSE